MSNRKGLCWECQKRDSCSMFRKNPMTIVSDCGRFEKIKHAEEVAEATERFKGKLENGYFRKRREV